MDFGLPGVSYCKPLLVLLPFHGCLSKPGFVLPDEKLCKAMLATKTSDREQF